MKNETSLGTRLLLQLATGFGLGLSPIASGTTGTLLGIPLAWGVMQWGSLASEIVTAGILCLLAIPICDVAEKHFGKKDDGRIVADEFLTFPVCMLGLPFIPWVVFMAFITNRICDIIKPPPARGLQELKGGLGIVVDDVIAALYSLGLNHVLYTVAVRYVFN